MRSCSIRLWLWKGKKRRGSESESWQNGRELAATDGVMANSLNLAWIWTSPATNPPGREGNPCSGCNTNQQGIGQTEPLPSLGPLSVSCICHPWSQDTEDSIIKWLGADGVEDFTINNNNPTVVKNTPLPLALSSLYSSALFKWVFVVWGFIAKYYHWV